MLGTQSSLKTISLAVLVLLTVGLAGCLESDDGLPESYEQARDAPGTEWEPTNAESPITLRLLEPSGTTVNVEETTIVFLLYDSEADEPVRNVTFAPQDGFEENCSPSHDFCAMMPEMGHGTSPEESPEHHGFGVYEGMTNFSMSGEWILNVRADVDGERLEYEIALTAE